MVSIFINKDVFEPSYNDLKFTVQNCNYICTNLSTYWRRQWHPTPVLFAWKIPWMEKPGRLQSMGLLRVRHDWATSLSRIGEGNGNPLQCSCLENPRDGGAWWAAVYGVAQSRTWLKRLSSSSSKRTYTKLLTLLWRLRSHIYNFISFM